MGNVLAQRVNEVLSKVLIVQDTQVRLGFKTSYDAWPPSCIVYLLYSMIQTVEIRPGCPAYSLVGAKFA